VPFRPLKVLLCTIRIRIGFIVLVFANKECAFVKLVHNIEIQYIYIENRYKICNKEVQFKEMCINVTQ